MSDQGKDLEVRVAPADSIEVPADLNAAVAEVQYDRVLERPRERRSEPATVVLETVRFALDPKLTASTTLPDVRIGGDLAFRLLRGNGIPAVLRVHESTTGSR